MRIVCVLVLSASIGIVWVSSIGIVCICSISIGIGIGIVCVSVAAVSVLSALAVLVLSSSLLLRLKVFTTCLRMMGHDDVQRRGRVLPRAGAAAALERCVTPARRLRRSGRLLYEVCLE